MLEITTTTKTKAPHHLPYEEMKNTVLGQGYELSLVFCGSHLMRRLNREHRGRDYATDVLSFSLSKHSGEVFICQEVSRRRAREHGRSPKNYLALVFVHALVHLKGYNHGATMDEQEAQYRKRFSI